MDYIRLMIEFMLNDPDPINPGTTGTVIGFDSFGHILVDWDNGRRLNLIPDIDHYYAV